MGESVGEPVKTFVETVTRGGGGALNVPRAVAELVKTKTLGDLLHLHGVGQVLLVGEHKENSVAELILGKHAVEFLAGRVLVVLRVVDTIAIVGVDDEDNALRVLVVVAPERTDLVLTADVPNSE